MIAFIDIVRFMTVGCLAVIILLLSRTRAPVHQKLPALFFTVSVLGYLIVDWEPLRPYTIFYFFLLLAVSLPFVFWLFSMSLFNDRFRLKPWMGLVLVGVLAIQMAIFVLSHMGMQEGIKNMPRIMSIVQPALPLLFVVLGIIAATRGWDADLIAARQQFRIYFILLTAILIVFTLLSEIAFFGDQAPLWLEFIQKFFIAGLTFYFASYRLLIKPGFFMKPSPAAPQAAPPVPPVDTVLLNDLQELMNHQEYWRTEGLTIRQLAATMQVKEYKLRQMINQHLGFRNFNDFLHSYRIKAACNLLADPKKRDMTILEIAYEMGYSSLAPFNKAFKQLIGMTPTEWRRSKRS